MKNSLKKIFYLLIPDKLIMRRGESSTVYLTFDDGPYNQHFKTIVDGLRNNNVQATFFVNGDSIANYIGLLKQMYHEGNSIGNHSYSHIRHKHFSFKETIKDIRKTNIYIQSITKIPCTIYRPPYGELTLPTILYSLIKGITIVMWSYESRDSFVKSYEEIQQSLNSVKGGDILLFHSDSEITASNITKIISQLKSKGLKFGTLSHI